MTEYDFEGMTAEQFVAQVPFHENHRFEWKASPTLTNPKFDFELGKQVSAFANSGGGFLILGIKNDRTFDAFPPLNPRDRPTRKDWLVGKVNRSVDFPLKAFNVHSLPLAKKPEDAIYVVEIPDSLSAPHRAVDEGRYYYRLDGQSREAPHFYVELLCSRTTKAKLKLRIDQRRFTKPPMFANMEVPDPTLSLLVTVENVSMQCAERWGVRVKATNDLGNCFKCEGRTLDRGVYVHHFNERVVLVPLHDEQLEIKIEPARQKNWPFYSAHERWANFGVELVPVSQNAVGEPIRLEWGDGTELQAKVFDSMQGLYANNLTEWGF